MSIKELLIYFMGKDVSSIEQSAEAVQNKDLFLLAREYLTILDYMYNERYHEYGPDDLKQKLQKKKQLEFYIKMTYDLNLNELGQQCWQKNNQTEFSFTTVPKQAKKVEVKSPIQRVERSLELFKFITTTELAKRRDIALTNYLEANSVEAKQVAICFYVYVEPDGSEQFVDAHNLEKVLTLVKQLYQTSLGTEIVVGLSITLLDRVVTAEDKKIILASCVILDEGDC